MGKGLFLGGILAIACVTISSAATVNDYFVALAPYFGISPSLVSDVCSCTLERINTGQCNGICQLQGCTNVTKALKQCSQGCTSTTADLACTVALGKAETECPVLGDYFPVNETVCTEQLANFNYLYDGLELHTKVRESCQAMNDYIAAGNCQSTCSQTTCLGYLLELQLCARDSGVYDCYKAVRDLRSHVISGGLTCDNFNAGAICQLPQTADSVANATYSTFDELVPYSFKMVLGPAIIEECQCINITSCSFCNAAQTTCEAWTVLIGCANDSPACNTTYCATNLTEVATMLTNDTCWAPGEDPINCTDAFPDGLFECTPLDFTTCQDKQSAVESNSTVPIFEPLPTPSTSPSPSLTPSTSPSPTFTPSRIFPSAFPGLQCDSGHRPFSWLGVLVAVTFGLLLVAV